MKKQNNNEEIECNTTQDFLPSDGASCSESSYGEKLDALLAECREINSEFRASLERLHILANTETTD